MIILFKYCADVKNCGSFKNFGFIYIYIYIDNNNNNNIIIIIIIIWLKLLSKS